MLLQLSMNELILLLRVWGPERNARFIVRLLKYVLYAPDEGLSLIGARLGPGQGR